MRNLTRVLKDIGERLAPPPNTKHHDAAADAEWQMNYLINIWKGVTDGTDA